jgi:hypothetical protein
MENQLTSAKLFAGDTSGFIFGIFGNFWWAGQGSVTHWPRVVFGKTFSSPEEKHLQALKRQQHETGKSPSIRWFRVPVMVGTGRFMHAGLQKNRQLAGTLSLEKAHHPVGGEASGWDYVRLRDTFCQTVKNIGKP